MDWDDIVIKIADVFMLIVMGVLVLGFIFIFTLMIFCAFA